MASIYQQIREVLEKEIRIKDELEFSEKCEEELDAVMEGITMRIQELKQERE